MLAHRCCLVQQRGKGEGSVACEDEEGQGSDEGGVREGEEDLGE